MLLFTLSMTALAGADLSNLGEVYSTGIQLVLLSDHFFGSAKISALQLPLIRGHRGHLMKSSVFYHRSAEKCKMRSRGVVVGGSGIKYSGTG